MFCGLYYVRMEMNTPGHPDRIERAEIALNGPVRSPEPPPVRVIVVRSDEAVKTTSTPSIPEEHERAPAVAEPKEPEPVVEASPTPKVDTTYRLIDRIYRAPRKVQSDDLDFFGKKVITTTPGTLFLRFKGVATNTEYPTMEAKVSMADLFIIDGVYTRDQINKAKK